MPKNLPYIIRRKDTFAFRIGVPKELRSYIGCREIIRSLHTSNRKKAEPIALELAAKVKRLFLELRDDMSGNKKKHNSISSDYGVKLDFGDFTFEVEGEPHEAEAINNAVKIAIESNNSRQAKNININPPTRSKSSELMLSKVIQDFLEYPGRAKATAMLKKYQTVLPMLIEVLGDMSIKELRQTDINTFFDTVQKLPPKWKYLKTKKKISILELASQKHSITINPKTFKSTYLACIRVFLTETITNLQDKGFPNNLTTNGIKYYGDRNASENKQRSLTPKELKRIFEGDEMKSFSQTKELAHFYWLPHIGLFTGARVNEICQLNPQTDILQCADSGIWHFWITGETEGDERILKRTKNKVSRRFVPIHSKLLELGLIDYVNDVKNGGHKLIFPKWVPSRGKASSNAEKWFRAFLKEIGVRDETPHKRVVGMHVFRSTFSNKAFNAGVQESSIVGHAGEGTSVERDYQGELSLVNKQKILEQINYDINFIQPIFIKC